MRSLVARMLVRWARRLDPSCVLDFRAVRAAVDGSSLDTVSFQFQTPARLDGSTAYLLESIYAQAKSGQGRKPDEQ